MKKLIPAICMTLIAAFMLASSTFAWFSMNTTVTATGMQVSAKTESAYLIIAAGDALTGSEKSASADLSASLYPTKPVVETLDSTNIKEVTSWGTATSTDPNNATTGAVLKPLESGATLSNYVAKQSFMVGIVPNSGEVANPLRLASVTISDVNDGITVVVVCGEHVYSHNNTVTPKNEELAATNLVTTAGVKVDVYIYIDGSNENVYSANAKNLSGTVTLTFTIEAPAA